MSARRRTLFATTAAFALFSITCPLAAARAQQAQIHYSIPAQPLPQALLTYAQQSNLSISAPEELTAGLRSAAVTGDVTQEEGLRGLLAGSGLKFEFVDAASVRIYRPTAQQPSAEAPKAAANAPSTREIEEVTVTAQKRSQPLDEVPVSITAVTAQQMQDLKVEQIVDLARLTPGFQASMFSGSSPIFAIRGAANNFTEIGVDKPVAIIIDDVYIPRYSAANIDLFDLAQAEVLRGPQGTLFGRNVTGGAVVLTTEHPSLDTTEERLQTGFGNYGSYEIQGLVSGPVTDEIAAKLSISREANDGYGTDRLLDRKQDDQDDVDARAQILFKPSAEFSLLLSADGGQDRNNGRTLSSLGIGDDGDARSSVLGVPQGFSRSIAGGSAHADWVLDPGTVTSITAYRTSSSNDLYSYTGVAYPLLPSSDYQEIDDEAEQVQTFTKELRFTSRSFGMFNFVSGLYYMHENGTKQYTVTDLQGLTGAYKFGSPTIDYESVVSQSYAAYADGTAHLTDDLDLSIGARFTDDTKEAGETQVNLTSPSYNFSQSGLNGSWDRMTPRATLTWFATEDAMVYASAAQGFTSGGFNTEAEEKSGLDTPFKPEIATNYEIGSKSNWLDHRLSTNLALFDTEYKDKQEKLYSQDTGVTIFNAARATARGVEIEVSAKPTDTIQINADYAYLLTKYNSFPEEPGDAGHVLATSPRNKFGVNAVDTIALGRFGDLRAAASYTWQSSYYTDFTESPTEFVRQYGLLDGTLAYQPPASAWKFTLWGKNLLNKSYVLIPSDTDSGLAEWLGPPRTFGVTALVQF